jgi:hypothetical protein
VPDLALSVVITRTALALPPLELNDHIAYYVGPTFMGGSLAWSRTQIGSPWLDGMVTVHRSRQMVTEPVQLEVLGGDQAELDANMLAAVRAFSQSDFQLIVTLQGEARTYECEAADQTLLWTGPRAIAGQMQVTFQVPRQPVPSAGAF